MRTKREKGPNWHVHIFIFELLESREDYNVWVEYSYDLYTYTCKVNDWTSLTWKYHAHLMVSVVRSIILTTAAKEYVVTSNASLLFSSDRSVGGWTVSWRPSTFLHMWPKNAKHSRIGSLQSATIAIYHDLNFKSVCTVPSIWYNSQSCFIKENI